MKPSSAVPLALLALAACSVGADPNGGLPIPVDARDDFAETNEDTAVLIDVLANDSGNPETPLTIGMIPEVEHGEVEIVDGQLRFLPEANFHGQATVRYRATQFVLGDTALVTITVHPVADPPVAQANRLTTARNNALAVVLTGDDVDGDPLQFTVTANPIHGTLSGTPPNLVYTPAPDYLGSDALRFQVTDGAFTSPDAEVAIEVTPGTPPIADTSRIQAVEDTPITFTLAVSDPDGDPLSGELVSFPVRGQITGTFPTYTYVAEANFYGFDYFSYTVSDGIHTSESGLVFIDVAARNDAPVAQTQNVSSYEDEQRWITLAGTDVDGDDLTYSVLTPPQHGVLSGSGNHLLYTPAANYNGPDLFTFAVDDGLLQSAPVPVHIHVLPVNDRPTISDLAIATDEDLAVAVSLTGSDVDGDAVTLFVGTPPLHGTLSGTAPDLMYTPDANVNGTDFFVYHAFDGTDYASATVTITVAPVADPPLPQHDVSMVAGGQTVIINVLGNDIDYDGDVLTVTNVGAPARGSAVLNMDGTISYTPDPSFTQDTDSFFYTVQDPDGLLGVTTVHVGVDIFPVDVPIEVATTASSIYTLISAISGDGRHVAFTSYRSDLVPGDTNNRYDVFVLDRSTRVVERVSVDSAGQQGNGNSYDPRISADGRVVVFVSNASNLAVGDNNGHEDIFAHDRSTGVTTLVSRGITGDAASGPSTSANISADGRQVGFLSMAPDLVPADTNGYMDVFVRDLQSHAIERVSVDSAGLQSDLPYCDDACRPSLSADGSVVAFESGATNLVPGDANGVNDIFVRDRVAGTTERISVADSGLEGNGTSRMPTLSADGLVVSFRSAASNLVAGDTNGVNDIFVHDRTTGSTTRVSLEGVDQQSALVSYNADMSADGRYVAITAAGTGYRVYVRDRLAGISMDPCVSRDGVAANRGCEHLRISGDGRYVVFASQATNLVDPPPSGYSTLYVAPNPL